MSSNRAGIGVEVSAKSRKIPAAYGNQPAKFLLFAYLPACDRFLIFQTNRIREKLETEFANVVIVTAEHIVAQYTTPPSMNNVKLSQQRF